MSAENEPGWGGCLIVILFWIVAFVLIHFVINPGEKWSRDIDKEVKDLRAHVTALEQHKP